MIAPQALWCNKHIENDNKSVYLLEVSKKGLNYESQKLKAWDQLKQECSSHDNKRFLFMQLFIYINFLLAMIQLCLY